MAIGLVHSWSMFRLNLSQSLTLSGIGIGIGSGLGIGLGLDPFHGRVLVLFLVFNFVLV